MMTTFLTGRAQLEAINRQTLRYPLMMAEKDYFLALAIKQIFASSLQNKLIFKGGTALHHCYFPQARFSEDLDFNLQDKNLTSEELISTIEARGIFVAKKVFTSATTLKIEKLSYVGLLGQPGNIKLEIATTQGSILPVKAQVYQNVWGVKTLIKVMDLKEICAEKIRATAQRVRYRDFYDLFLLMEKLKFSLTMVIKILRQKQITSLISPQKIWQNWQAALKLQESDLASIMCSQKIDDRLIEAMVRNLNFRKIKPR